MKKGDWGTAGQLHEKELREKYMCLYGNEKEYTLLLDTMKQYYENVEILSFEKYMVIT